MEMKLAENIRLFRKERGLTQEQLAEVLGVTVGAVYKWEARLSVPELKLIVEMADFFDTSVDVLLGYEMKDNRLASTVRRLKEYRRNKDHAGLAEAEKALKKYPNAFDVVYNSAVLYNVFGLESQDKRLLRRALELLEYSRRLLSQNTDPEIGELTIYGSMANAYIALGEGEHAVEILKKQLAAQFYYKNIPIFCLAVFSSLFSGSLNLILSWTMQQLIDVASGNPGALPIGILVWISGGFMLLCIASCLLDYISTPRYIERAMRQYKDFAFQKLTEKSISSFRDENTAAYLSALTNDAANIETNYLEQQLSLITKSVTFIGALAMMLWYSPLMTAIAIGVTMLPFAASLLTGSKLETAERRVSDKNRDFTASLSDCLGGFAVVRSFKAEKEVFRLFAAGNKALEDEKFSKRRIKTIVGMIGAVAGIFAQLGVFLIGAYLALSGRGLTPGVVIMFVNLMNFIIQPIAELPGLLAGRKAALGLIDKLAEALVKNPESAGSAEISRLEKGIVLENVSFGYDENKEVLHHISCVFEAGKAYAVVGGSGSGKSTLLNLLMAAGSDYSGKIMFDGMELRSITAESLYELMSVIQQNVFVFNASIRDNVTMFRSFAQKERPVSIYRCFSS